jgi:hypothetical protein
MCEICQATEASGQAPTPTRRALILASLAALVPACGRREPQQAYRYVVEDGDTLSLVADRSGLSVGQIIDANRLESRHLQPGQVLWLPDVKGLRPHPPSMPSEPGLALIGRSSWGAKPLGKNFDPMAGISRLTIHHTAEIPGMMDRQDLDLIRAVQRFHQQTNGWADLGYHFLIGRDGHIYEGRPLYAQGAHCGGDNNKHNIGVAVIGDCDRQLPNRIQLAATRRFLDHLQHEHHIRRDQLFSHRDFKVTACPGRALYEWYQGYKRTVTA